MRTAVELHKILWYLSIRRLRDYHNIYTTSKFTFLEKVPRPIIVRAYGKLWFINLGLVQNCNIWWNQVKQNKMYAQPTISNQYILNQLLENNPENAKNVCSINKFNWLGLLNKSNLYFLAIAKLIIGNNVWLI